MNSEQLRLFLSGAFSNQADARKIRKQLSPSLQRALDRVLRIVEGLPDESLRRQRDWRAMLDAVDLALQEYNDDVLITITDQLPESGLKAAEETVASIRSSVPRLAGVVPPEAVMADSTKWLLNTKVGPKRLIDLFISDGLSPFTKSPERMIDLIVTGGIIRGESTADIAKLIADQLPGRLQGQETALARTAIQDYNRQVKEAVWDANQEMIETYGLQYEWVAALDSRTCPTCAPLDGQVKPKKNDFPSTPVHVNCRCSVVLVDPTDEGRVRYGQEAMVEQPDKDKEGSYRTKKKVKGETLWRRNRKVEKVGNKSPRYADFLASADRKTQQMFFGGGNAGSIRAEKFRKSIKNGTSPQQALINLTNIKDSKKKTRLFKPVKD